MAKMGMKGAQFNVHNGLPMIAGISPRVKANIMRLKPKRMKAMPLKPMKISSGMK